MLQRFLESLLLFIVLVPFGHFVGRTIFRRQQSDLLASLLIGYFAVTSILVALAFFVPVGAFFFYGFFCISGVLIFIDGKTRNALQAQQWFPLVLALLLASAIAAFAVKMPDEALYYLQTVQALGDEGWIKGIGNLEPRFALGSSLHVFGAATTLFGDAPLKLNALLLAIAIYQAYERLREGKKRNAAYWLVVALGGLPFYFLLIPSQSPDFLGVMIVASLVEQLFLQKKADEHFAAILLGTAILLKPNIALSAAILVLTWFSFNPRWKQLLRYCPFFIVPAILFITKNILATGYPLYPIAAFPLDLPWTIPKEAFSLALDFLKAGQVASVDPAQSHMDRLHLLFFELGLKSALLWAVVAVSILLVVITVIKRRKTLIQLTVATFLILPLWLMLNTTPNFRLGMHYLIPLAAFLVAELTARKHGILKKGFKNWISAGLAFLTILLFAMPRVDFSSFVANPAYNDFQPLEARNLLYPREPKLPKDFCGNAEFPCVTADLYIGYETKYHEGGGYFYLKQSEN